MKPEDIHVEFRDGVLTVHGKREEAKEEEGKTYHRVERRYGEFRRVIPLATSVEEEQVEARYTNGVLHITVPKTEKAQPKPIEVKT